MALGSCPTINPHQSESPSLAEPPRSDTIPAVGPTMHWYTSPLYGSTLLLIPSAMPLELHLAIPSVRPTTSLNTKLRILVLVALHSLVGLPVPSPTSQEFPLDHLQPCWSGMRPSGVTSPGQHCLLHIRTVLYDMTLGSLTFVETPLNDPSSGPNHTGTQVPPLQAETAHAPNQHLQYRADGSGITLNEV